MSSVFETSPVVIEMWLNVVLATVMGSPARADDPKVEVGQ